MPDSARTAPAARTGADSTARAAVRRSPAPVHAGVGLPRTAAALQALDGWPLHESHHHPDHASDPLAPEAHAMPHDPYGPLVPATELVRRQRDLDQPSPRGTEGPDPAMLDQLVDMVVDRIEERVVSELERRGQRGIPGVF